MNFAKFASFALLVVAVSYCAADSLHASDASAQPNEAPLDNIAPISQLSGEAEQTQRMKRFLLPNFNVKINDHNTQNIQAKNLAMGSSF